MWLKKSSCVKRLITKNCRCSRHSTFSSFWFLAFKFVNSKSIWILLDTPILAICIDFSWGFCFFSQSIFPTGLLIMFLVKIICTVSVIIKLMHKYWTLLSQVIQHSYPFCLVHFVFLEFSDCFFSYLLKFFRKLIL